MGDDPLGLHPSLEHLSLQLTASCPGFMARGDAGAAWSPWRAKDCQGRSVHPWLAKDSLPLPVCKRVRARRCKKVRGAAFCGYCAAKKEKFFGWRLHLITTPAGIPVSFALLEASHHDLILGKPRIHELCYVLPQGACVYGDKGYNSADDEATLLEETGVKLVPTRRRGMKAQNTLSEFFALQRYRKGIETLNSQLQSMGIQQLRARTNQGYFIKTHASLGGTDLHQPRLRQTSN